MDSLTQIVLGAACGEVVLGKKIGNKALFFGAIGGTLPDLDVFVGKWLYSNEIQAMAFHRGFMHSIVFTVLAAFIFGWLVHKLYNSGKRLHSTTQKDWINLFFWSLFTHPILDCFTPYGTQLFAPFSSYRVALNNIAVIYHSQGLNALNMQTQDSDLEMQEDEYLELQAKTQILRKVDPEFLLLETMRWTPGDRRCRGWLPNP